MTSSHGAADRQAYIIEIGETAAGIVNRLEGETQYTFISAASAFHGLDGHRFPSPRAAELAARQFATSRRGS